MYGSTDSFSVVEDVCVINVDGLFTIHNRKVTAKIKLFSFKSDHSLMCHIVFFITFYYKIQRNFKLYNEFCFVQCVCVCVSFSIALADMDS